MKKVYILFLIMLSLTACKKREVVKEQIVKAESVEVQQDKVEWEIITPEGTFIGTNLDISKSNGVLDFVTTDGYCVYTNRWTIKAKHN